MIHKILTIVILSVFSFAIAENSNLGGTVKDAKGNVYRTHQVGKQIWMIDNLKLKTKTSTCYEDKNENCDKYGVLYQEIETVQCPSGFHVPSSTEWETLIQNLGGNPKATEYMKKKMNLQLVGGGLTQDGCNSMGEQVAFWSSSRDYVEGDYEGTGMFWDNVFYEVLHDAFNGTLLKTVAKGCCVSCGAYIRCVRTIYK